jgi:hypothetical protein
VDDGAALEEGNDDGAELKEGNDDGAALKEGISHIPQVFGQSV